MDTRYDFEIKNIDYQAVEVIILPELIKGESLIVFPPNCLERWCGVTLERKIDAAKRNLIKCTEKKLAIKREIDIILNKRG